MTAQAGHNSAAADELRSIVERIVNLQVAKDDILADIKDIKAEAKSKGFDVKAIDRIVKDKRESMSQRLRRLETEAITDVYRASLGMLDGTPLGEAARKRLSRPPIDDEDKEAGSDEQDTSEQPATSAISPEEISAAREQGKEARRAGKRIFDNPFVAGDPRRASWDEGWCAEDGSDGMNIPAAWRRAADKKPKKGGEE